MGFNSDLETLFTIPFQSGHHYPSSFDRDHEALLLQDPRASTGLAGFDDMQTMQNSLNWTTAGTTTSADISGVVFSSLNDPLELEQHMDWESPHTSDLKYSAVETGSAEEAIRALKPTTLSGESLRRSLNLEGLEAAKVSNSSLAPLIVKPNPQTGIGRAFSGNHGKRAQMQERRLSPKPLQRLAAPQTREKLGNDTILPKQGIANPTRKRWSPTRRHCQPPGLSFSLIAEKPQYHPDQVAVKLTIDSNKRACLESMTVPTGRRPNASHPEIELDSIQRELEPSDDDESSSDDEPIIISDRNSSPNTSEPPIDLKNMRVDLSSGTAFIVFGPNGVES